MKNLKLLFLTLLSVLSFNTYSQNILAVTNTSGPNICDGTILIDTTGVQLNTIYVTSNSVPISQGVYYITNLCPGDYYVTSMTVNGGYNTDSVTITPCLNFGGYINTIDSTLSNGTMTAYITNGTMPYTYQWSNGVTSPTINGLVSGVYCCFISDANGCMTSICDTVGSQSTNSGDTLVINSANMCNNPIGTLTSMLEDCNLNYNSIDSAFISSITVSQNPFDSVVVTWTLVDTNGVNVVQYSVYTIVPSTGCYNFQLIVYCSQKSMNYKTIIANATWYMDNVGIEELSSLIQRKLIKVIDLMGRETNLQPNMTLIKCYSDGTTERVYINN